MAAARQQDGQPSGKRSRNDTSHEISDDIWEGVKKAWLTLSEYRGTRQV